MKCLIITSYLKNIDLVRHRIEAEKFDFCICADGGYNHAKSLGITPNLIIGDFDSAGVPGDFPVDNIILLPKEKDVTDADAALAKAVELGAEEIFMLSTMGGRLDHTLGVLAIIAKNYSPSRKIKIFDGQNETFMLRNSSARIPSARISRSGYQYMSLVSYSPVCYGVTESGVKYPLWDTTLTNEMTLGISNEITEDYADVSVGKGDMLVILSKDI